MFLSMSGLKRLVVWKVFVFVVWFVGFVRVVFGWRVCLESWCAFWGFVWLDEKLCGLLCGVCCLGGFDSLMLIREGGLVCWLVEVCCGCLWGLGCGTCVVICCISCWSAWMLSE